jgi:pimeloyl-ACP methyl ester carboxylesterase
LQEWMIDALLERATSSPMLRVAQAGVLQHLLDARLPQLDVPTTLIWGADDGVLPVAYAEALRAKIKGSTLQIIEGAAHIPHRQQPERFLACLTAT